MYSFDGQFRRLPIQNLSGNSKTSNRDEIIKKAQFERQKRNELRKQNNGAIIIQSQVRSFLDRQHKKHFERENFDKHFKENNLKLINDSELNHLIYLLKRILFFYDTRLDSERLIDILKHIIKIPEIFIKKSSEDTLWLYRLKKLLLICLRQLCFSNLNQAIPLRTLEIYTEKSSVEKYLENVNGKGKYILEDIFIYLIKYGNYFKRIRKMLQERCPPLDGECFNAPNQFCGALFELLMRPLLLIDSNTTDYVQKLYCTSFSENILSPIYTDAVRYYILPMIAKCKEFPFGALIFTLGEKILNTNVNERMKIDGEDEIELNTSAVLTSFLLNSIFIIDVIHYDELIENSILLGNYIKIISTISPKILQLPKSTLKLLKIADDDSSSDSESEQSSKCSTYCQTYNLSILEQNILLEIVQSLNNSERVKIICGNIQHFIRDPTILHYICQLCHNLMVYNKNAIMDYELLFNFAFMPDFIRSIWTNLASESSQQGFSCPLSLISKGMVPKSDDEINRTIAFLATFCALFGRLLPTRHDGEFQREFLENTQRKFGNDKLMPFSIEEIVHLSKTLKEISLGLVELAFPETRSSLTEHYRSVLGRSNSEDEKIKQKKQIWTNLLNVVVAVLNQIHTRDLRMQFCPKHHWTVNTLNLPLDKPTDLPLTRGSRTRGIRPFQPIRDFTREDFENSGGPPISTKQIRSITILREIPFVVRFNQRVSILQGLIAADKIRVQGELQGFLQGPSIQLLVRRSHIYEDAYDKLRPENEPDLRHKFRVQFSNSLGLAEAGIDGGGLFREFLSELIKVAFDPNRGFFMITTDNRLYPNPSVNELVPDFEKHFYFMGRILGKAIYENLLVELPLAEFFLSKLAGKYSDVDVHQLASLDPELYKNLLSLKEYDGDVSELGLDFTVVNNNLGKTAVTELKPNGQSILVNSSNKIEYIQLMADYKLNKQIRQHCVAFRRGLSNVLPVEWLYMFSNKELQILISGAEIPIDTQDLQRYCKYGGEYTADHPTIRCFWKVFDNFTDLEKRQLLKFVTSCSRPPLLGFKDLDPPFFIQNAGDDQRLPTASTCTNLLKLPNFKTTEQMREKLLYAIQAEAGFDLS